MKSAQKKFGIHDTLPTYSHWELNGGIKSIQTHLVDTD